MKNLNIKINYLLNLYILNDYVLCNKEITYNISGLYREEQN